MVDTYRGKGPVVFAKVYTPEESERLARDLSAFIGDPGLLVREYSRVIRAEGWSFDFTVVIVRRRVKGRGDA